MILPDTNFLILQGSVFNTKTSVIAHQTNCKGIMGSGVAKQIKEMYPEVFEEYKKKCDFQNMLGECLLVKTHDNRYIANLFGQYGFGLDGQYTNYNAVNSAMKNLLREMKQLGLTSVAFPYNFGCGRGGGQWQIVDNIIRGTFKDTGMTIEFWKI